MLVLPSFAGSYPRWEYVVALDGINYGVRFNYNFREDSWYIDLFDADGNSVLAGIKLVVGYRLLASRRYLPGLPPGELIVVDTEMDPTTARISEKSLGARYVLVYATAAEMVEIDGL